MRDGEAMTDASAIEAATRRLAAALDALDAAVERRREADRSESALAAQVQALGTDRSKLASDLDTVTARSSWQILELDDVDEGATPIVQA